MNTVTRSEVWELAKSRKDELIGLVSRLIQIPSENPTGSQREVIDFVEQYLTDAGIGWFRRGIERSGNGTPLAGR